MLLAGMNGGVARSATGTAGAAGVGSGTGASGSFSSFGQQSPSLPEGAGQQASGVQQQPGADSCAKSETKHTHTGPPAAGMESPTQKSNSHASSGLTTRRITMM